MDKQAKIVWAMSYMKAGQAAKWSAHVFGWEEQPENVGYHKFVDWEDFWDEFKREFCPVYADSAAINQLESTAYFQRVAPWMNTSMNSKTLSRKLVTPIQRA